MIITCYQEICSTVYGSLENRVIIAVDQPLERPPPNKNGPRKPPRALDCEQRKTAGNVETIHENPIDFVKYPVRDIDGEGPLAASADNRLSQPVEKGLRDIDVRVQYGFHLL